MATSRNQEKIPNNLTQVAEDIIKFILNVPSTIELQNAHLENLISILVEVEKTYVVEGTQLGNPIYMGLLATVKTIVQKYCRKRVEEISSAREALEAIKNQDIMPLEKYFFTLEIYTTFLESKEGKCEDTSANTALLNRLIKLLPQHYEALEDNAVLSNLEENRKNGALVGMRETLKDIFIQKSKPQIQSHKEKQAKYEEASKVKPPQNIGKLQINTDHPINKRFQEVLKTRSLENSFINKNYNPNLSPQERMNNGAKRIPRTSPSLNQTKHQDVAKKLTSLFSMQISNKTPISIKEKTVQADIEKPVLTSKERMMRGAGKCKGREKKFENNAAIIEAKANLAAFFEKKLTISPTQQNSAEKAEYKETQIASSDAPITTAEKSVGVAVIKPNENMKSIGKLRNNENFQAAFQVLGRFLETKKNHATVNIDNKETQIASSDAPITTAEKSVGVAVIKPNENMKSIGKLRNNENFQAAFQVLGRFLETKKNATVNIDNNEQIIPKNKMLSGA